MYLPSILWNLPRERKKDTLVPGDHVAFSVHGSYPCLIPHVGRLAPRWPISPFLNFSPPAPACPSSSSSFPAIPHPFLFSRAVRFAYDTVGFLYSRTGFLSRGQLVSCPSFPTRCEASDRQPVSRSELRLHRGKLALGK